MSLAIELSAVYTKFHTYGPPEISKLIRDSTTEHVASFDVKAAIKAGDTLPAFTLSDVFGKEVSSADLLSKGPILVTFYRGEVCTCSPVDCARSQDLCPQKYLRAKLA